MDRLGPFEKNPHLGIAVSGGVDSLALTFLLHEWTRKHNGSLSAFHVDHGLRPESSSEARQVKNWLESKEIPCFILKWDHQHPPVARIQEKARLARYQLLESACAEHNILHLFTAHHAEDQQETYVMRSQHQSTSYGLAGMSAITYFDHCRLIRPLLSIHKNQLKDFLGTHPHIEDSSNQNMKFLRVQLRHKETQPVDLLPYQQERQKQEQQLAQFFALWVDVAPEGYGLLDFKSVETTNPTLMKKALGHLIRTIGNGSYLPSPRSVQSLYQKWINKNFSATSVGKCVVYVKNKKIWVVPDRRLLPTVMTLRTGEILWDRFIAQQDLPAEYLIQPLGKKGWSQLDSIDKEKFLYPVALSFPSYWKENKLIEVPFLKTEHSADPTSFLYSPKNSLLAEFFV